MPIEKRFECSIAKEIFGSDGVMNRGKILHEMSRVPEKSAAMRPSSSIVHLMPKSGAVTFGSFVQQTAAIACIIWGNSYINFSFLPTYNSSCLYI